MEPDEIRQEIHDLTGEVTPLTLDPAAVAKAVRRKRASRAGLSAGAAALALVGAGYVAQLPSAGSQAAAPAAPTGTSASPGYPTVQQRALTCGSAVAGPIDAGATHAGVTLGITRVAHKSGGGLALSADFTSPRRVTMLTTPGPTQPTVLLLKNGVIVATPSQVPVPPVPTGGPVTTTGDGVARVAHLDASHPMTVQLHLDKSALCPGYDWSTAWAQGAGYQVAVIVSDLQVGNPGGVPTYRPGYTAPDPLLMVTVPLRTR